MVPMRVWWRLPVFGFGLALCVEGFGVVAPALLPVACLRLHIERDGERGELCRQPLCCFVTLFLDGLAVGNGLRACGLRGCRCILDGGVACQRGVEFLLRQSPGLGGETTCVFLLRDLLQVFLQLLLLFGEPACALLGGGRRDGVGIGACGSEQRMRFPCVRLAADGVGERVQFLRNGGELGAVAGHRSGLRGLFLDVLLRLLAAAFHFSLQAG